MILDRLAKTMRRKRDEAEKSWFSTVTVSSVSGSVATVHEGDTSTTFEATIPASVTGVTTGSRVELLWKGPNPIVLFRYS